MGIRNQQTALSRIENYTTGHGQAPFHLNVPDLSAPFHNLRVGRHHRPGPLGKFLGITDQADEEPAFRGENLHPVVAPIADVNIPVRVNRHIRRPVKLSPVGAIAAKLGHKLALGSQLLHPVILVVGQVNVPLGIQGDSPRTVKLSRAAAEVAKLGLIRSVGGELLHPVVAAVNHVNGILGVDVNTGGAAELAGAAAFLSPIGHIFAVPVEYGHPVQPFVGDVSIALRVQGNTGGPDQLTGGIAVPAELRQPFLVLRLAADRNDADPGSMSYSIPGSAGNILRPSACHVNFISRTQAHTHRQAEPGSRHRSPAYRPVVVKHSSGR